MNLPLYHSSYLCSTWTTFVISDERTARDPTQLNSTQLNSTQLNSTQLNSTQLNPTQPRRSSNTQQSKLELVKHSCLL
ncbi:predicted protein [Plenodomus lingam JN3]|uniref:Predicted protein n=1 Tax=Leptosphaeria maculans (strain JN3 / isolate v23.1.3 / race Av1-4-5-6-7-8) TaxID=985895 RepID=E4ZHE8_LEPMJ|nr:predicted protein [Plenodomus lingam JN3]CBX90718.1 predicted protein [Plenodomus lingam JN3]